MLAERSKKLEEHHEKLGAIIANLQIEKAKQVELPRFVFLISVHSAPQVLFSINRLENPRRIIDYF